ncbi:MAG: threonine aldolase family protein [Pseudomonadota bacterium]
MHNFFSDTQTKPSRAMLETVFTADVGDEQRGEDATTRKLEARVAELLGKDAAVYMPSGTMCNEIAIHIHCRPGDEIICAAQSHIVGFEGGGPAALSGTMMRLIETSDGTFTAADVTAALRSGSRYEPRSRLVSVEQTVNVSGGIVWPIEQLAAVGAAARAAGLGVHMDGARLMNAAVASGRPAAEHTAAVDSVWIDFTKGLGAPFGAVLAGSEAFIAEAWRLKQRWGGAMRQSGIMAAMCLYALDHHVDRLAEDHALAASIAERLGDLAGVANVIPPHTNIVIFDLADGGPDASHVAAALAERDVQVCQFGERRIRLVTHHDVNGADADVLFEQLAEVLSA